MVTRLKGTKTEVLIGPGRPAVIIGDRINPVTMSALTEALYASDMSPVKQAARSQTKAGAEIIKVNVSGPGINEQKMLPAVVQAVAETVSLPLCIDTEDPAALAAALKVCPGRPLVSSISYKERALRELLPVAVKYGAAVIGRALDERGTPPTLEGRVELAREVLRKSITAGVARADVILDPLVLAVNKDPRAAFTTLETIARLVRIEAVNVTLRPRDLAEGLPQGEAIERAFIAVALHQGATCLTGDPGLGQEAVLIAGLLTGQAGAVGRYVDFISQG